ncbi:MAG: DNA primase [Candidatus Babeliales bacterium]
MNLFSYIKGQLTILDVISEYAKLKKAGIYWKGNCPFHNEKTASFTVSPHKEIFYCFGCHTGGDVITFISKAEHCTPMEAAKHLVDRYQLAIPDNLSTDWHTSGEEKNVYTALCTLFAQWCHEQLKKNPSVLKYVTHERSITPASIDYFTIGYFPGGLAHMRSYMNFMRSHNFLPDDLVKAHLIAQGKTVMYSPFEERIIFPIKDHLGRFCGFGGRIFKPHDERAKYYNSRENEYFTKGSLLFGLDAAKKSIQSSEVVFLVEGYTDCVAMVQHGFTNTVATLGTACTVEHLQALSRYAQRVMVAFDGDKAGQDAMLRLTELCWHVNMDLSVLQLPPKEDPASFLDKGGDIRTLTNKALDIFEYFIISLGTNFAAKSLSDKLQATRKIIAIIQRIEEPLKRDILLQKASKVLDIPVESIKQELKIQSKTHIQISSENTPITLPDPPVVSPEDNAPELEKKIFSAIMNNMQLLNKENEEYLLTYLNNDLIKSLLCILKDAKREYPSLDFIKFFDMLTPNSQMYVSKILSEFGGTEETSHQKDFEQLLLHIQKKNWKTIVNDIKMKLAHARSQGDHPTVEKILHDFLELKKKMLHKDLLETRGR